MNQRWGPGMRVPDRTVSEEGRSGRQRFIESRPFQMVLVLAEIVWSLITIGASAVSVKTCDKHWYPNFGFVPGSIVLLNALHDGYALLRHPIMKRINFLRNIHGLVFLLGLTILALGIQGITCEATPDVFGGRETLPSNCIAMRPAFCSDELIILDRTLGLVTTILVLLGGLVQMCLSPLLLAGGLMKLSAMKQAENETDSSQDTWSRRGFNKGRAVTNPSDGVVILNQKRSSADNRSRSCSTQVSRSSHLGSGGQTTQDETASVRISTDVSQCPYPVLEGSDLPHPYQGQWMDQTPSVPKEDLNPGGAELTQAQASTGEKKAPRKDRNQKLKTVLGQTFGRNKKSSDSHLGSSGKRSMGASSQENLYHSEDFIAPVYHESSDIVNIARKSPHHSLQLNSTQQHSTLLSSTQSKQNLIAPTDLETEKPRKPEAQNGAAMKPQFRKKIPKSWKKRIESRSTDTLSCLTSLGDNSKVKELKPNSSVKPEKEEDKQSKS